MPAEKMRLITRLWGAECMVGIGSAGDSFVGRFGNAPHDVSRRAHAEGGQASLPGGHHGPLLLALHLRQGRLGLEE